MMRVIKKVLIYISRVDERERKRFRYKKENAAAVVQSRAFQINNAPFRFLKYIVELSRPPCF